MQEISEQIEEELEQELKESMIEITRIHVERALKRAEDNYKQESRGKPTKRKELRRIPQKSRKSKHEKEN